MAVLFIFIQRGLRILLIFCYFKNHFKTIAVVCGYRCCNGVFFYRDGIRVGANGLGFINYILVCFFIKEIMFLEKK